LSSSVELILIPCSLYSPFRPVGDCHYYAIVKKWTNLQRNALWVQQECPNLVIEVHYDHILANRDAVVAGVYDFIGTRRFAGVARQSSVRFMDITKNLIANAKDGREAQKAKLLSYQFRNLGRGILFQRYIIRSG
jgi:hypothetical protein